jgi:long-chain fatty acid transport protein
VRLGLVAGALLWATTPADASLPDLFGFGPRSAALAGTGVATATGFEATYSNPAGLWAGRRQLDVGVVYGGYQVSLGGAAYPIDTTSGLMIGGSVPLPLGGVLANRIGLGIGIYTPFGEINRARDPFPDVPRAALVEGRSHVVSVLLGAGVRLPGGFSLGGGVLALAALIGTITITPDGSGRITSLSEEQVTVDYAPILGLRWQGLGERLSLGAVFRGVSRSTYKLVVLTQLGDAVPVTLPTISFAGVAQYDPLQVAAEVGFRPVPALLLSVQATWKRWSAYGYPVLPATASAAPLPDPQFHDTVVPRLSAELALPSPRSVALSLRGGYFFEWSPAPDPAAPAPTTDARPSNLLDANRHALTAGLGLRLTGGLPLRLALFGQGHFVAGHSLLGGGLGIFGMTIGADL